LSDPGLIDVADLPAGVGIVDGVVVHDGVVARPVGRSVEGEVWEVEEWEMRHNIDRLEMVDQGKCEFACVGVSVFAAWRVDCACNAKPYYFIITVAFVFADELRPLRMLDGDANVMVYVYLQPVVGCRDVGTNWRNADADSQQAH
jgi:hypothetical protein